MAKKKSQAQAKQRTAKLRGEQQGKMPAWIWLAGGGGVLIVVVIGLFYLGYQGQAIANSGIEGLVIIPAPARDHIDGDIEYASLTPPGGPHNPSWLNCGIFDEPVRAENVIHSMEHGAVWLAYQPQLPAEQIEILKNMVNRERSDQGEPLIILSPVPGLESPIVATAWQVQLALEDATDERLQDFLDRYQRGPFTPEPGASCAFGGVMN